MKAETDKKDKKKTTTRQEATNNPKYPKLTENITNKEAKNILSTYKTYK